MSNRLRRTPERGLGDTSLIAKPPREVFSRLNMRAPAETLSIIDRAAKAEHMDRTAFMLASALKCAREVLLDQALFVLNQEDWDRVINAPATPNAALRAFARESDPWD